MMYIIVGVILSISGFISGIISGIAFNNFGICLLVWITTFLYAIIYFGIGTILKKLESIENAQNFYRNNTPTSISSTNNFTDKLSSISSISIKNTSEWKCNKCGKINQNYVGTCGCGQTKESN